MIRSILIAGVTSLTLAACTQDLGPQQRRVEEEAIRERLRSWERAVNSQSLEVMNAFSHQTPDVTFAWSDGVRTRGWAEESIVRNERFTNISEFNFVVQESIVDLLTSEWALVTFRFSLDQTEAGGRFMPGRPLICGAKTGRRGSGKSTLRTRRETTRVSEVAVGGKSGAAPGAAPHPKPFHRQDVNETAAVSDAKRPTTSAAGGRVEHMSSLKGACARRHVILLYRNLPAEARQMSDPFLSSDDYGERAHGLYNEGRYEEAIDVLRHGLESYPQALELHIGMGYARLARDEFAWARASFEYAVALDASNEDALAGLGETLLRFGERDRALKYFDQLLALGFREDHDLMLQVGRALFREGVVDQARGFFEIAVECHPNSTDACACLGYAAHRGGDEAGALLWLRRALELDGGHSEARVYLGNLLYDRGEYDAALYHLERTEPQEHLEELALWRLIELKKSVYRLSAGDPELRPWTTRLRRLGEASDSVERLLAEVESKQPDGTIRDPRQLELFGALVAELHGMRRPAQSDLHRVRMADGVTYTGTWEQIVFQMRRTTASARASPSSNTWNRWRSGAARRPGS